MPRTEFGEAVFWNSLVPIMVIDAGTNKFLEVNSAALNLYGYSRGQFLRLPIKKIMPEKEVEYLLKYSASEDRVSSEPLGAWIQRNKLGELLYIRQNVQKFDYDGQSALLIHSLDITSEYLARLKLEEARKLNSTIIDNLPDGFFLLDERRQFIKWNLRFEDMTGYTGDELYNLSYQNLYEQTHEENVDEVMNRLANGESITIEVPLVRKDGTIFPCYYSARGFTIKGKRYIVGTCRDIRTLKKLEEKAAKEKKRFQQTFEQAAVGIANIAPDGSWLRVNDKFCQIVGYDRDELLKMNFQMLTLEEDLEIDLIHFQKLVNNEIDSYTVDKKYVKKTGEIIWVRITAASVRSEGKLEYAISVIQDITESVKLQEELRLNEERLIKAQEIGKIGNWEVDLEKDLIYWSDEVYRIYGIINKNSFSADFNAFEETIHPDDRKWVLKASESTVRGEGPLNIEHRIVLPDGRIRTVFERGKLIKNGRHGRPFLVGTVQDITDLKETERALRQALQEKEVALGEMHHRVKNNLAVISALFTLHTENDNGLTPEEVIELIEHQIKTISQVHEKLYESTDISRIPILRILQNHIRNELFTQGALQSISLPGQEIYINANQAITFFLLLSEVALELNHLCNEHDTQITNLNLFAEKECLNIVYTFSKKTPAILFSEVKKIFSDQPIISTLENQLGIQLKINSGLCQVYIRFEMKNVKGTATTILE